MTIHQIVDDALEERFPVAFPSHLHDDLLVALQAVNISWTPDLDVAYDEKWAVESFVRGFLDGYCGEVSRWANAIGRRPGRS